MFESFGSADVVSGTFVLGVILDAVVAIGLSASVLIKAGSHSRKRYMAPAIVLSVVAFAGLVWNSYSTTFRYFIAAEVAPTGVRLQFAGPLGRDLHIASDSIDAILFGLPGKRNSQCYIKFELKSGASYRSVTFDRDVDACKQLRREIIHALSPVRLAARKEAN